VGRLATVKENWSLGALAALLEALRKSNVATYSISTGDFSSAILRKVSVASGGFMMRAANFERDAERLIEDLDHYYMIRKQVYLDVRHDRMLKRRARQRGVTEAEIIREALDRVESPGVRPRTFTTLTRFSRR
jgi:hypothetical protein